MQFDDQVILTEPIMIGSLLLKHRVTLGPMWSRLCSVTGEVTQQMLDYYEARAKGGAAMIVIESTAVDNRYRWNEPTLRLDDPVFQPGFARLVDIIHLNGAAAIVQIVNIGTFSANPISPSGVASVMMGGLGIITPRIISLEEIEEQRDRFINTAVLAKEVGCDGVLVHGATAYLLHQFVSPYTNKRTDKYGGNLENRMRLPLEIIRGIRKKCGPDFVVGYELVVDELLQGGITYEDSIPFAKALEREGIDYLDQGVGTYETFGSSDRSAGLSKYTRFGSWEHSAAFKKEVNIPVVSRSHGDYDPHSWEQHIRAGDADIVQVAKPSLCDPEIFNKALEGRFDDIRVCTNCTHCMGVGVIGHNQVECALNPETGKERIYIIQQVSKLKNILVVGAGPAGLEAARVAAMRRHQVTLIDKESEPGGNLRYIALCLDNEPYGDFRNWEVRECTRNGVKITLGKEATQENIQEVNPDVLILATGASQRIIPEIPGISSPLVITPEDALVGKASIGEKVVVIGGNRIGVDISYTLAKKSLAKSIIIIEPRPVASVGYDMEILNMAIQTMCLLPKYGVQVLTGTQVKEITDDSVVLINPEGRKSKIDANTVILSMGYEASDRMLYKVLKGKVKELYEIGDCVKPRNVKHAIHEAAYIARQI